MEPLSLKVLFGLWWNQIHQLLDSTKRSTTKKLQNPSQKQKSCFSLRKVIGMVPANESSMAKSDIDDTNEQGKMLIYPLNFQLLAKRPPQYFS